MNNPVAPTEPTIDIEPSIPGEGHGNDISSGHSTGSQESKSGSQRLVYLLLIVVGMILIGSGAYERGSHHESWIPEVSIAAGVAILAPGILSALYRRYLLEEIKLEIQKPALEFKEEAKIKIYEATEEVKQLYGSASQLLRSAENAGLVGIYETRDDAVSAFIPYINAEKRKIVVVGSSLKGLVSQKEEAYEFALKALVGRINEHVEVQFLLTHPAVADLRAIHENRAPEAIGKEIIDSIQELTGTWRVPRHFIKLYLGTPTCFGIMTSQVMLLNPYPYTCEAYLSPCLIVEKSGLIYRQFHFNHFKAWETSSALRLPQNLNVLQDHLDDYAKRITQLLDSVRSGTAGNASHTQH